MEFDECYTFGLGGIILVCEMANRFWLESSKVLLNCLGRCTKGQVSLNQTLASEAW